MDSCITEDRQIVGPLENWVSLAFIGLAGHNHALANPHFVFHALTSGEGLGVFFDPSYGTRFGPAPNELAPAVQPDHPDPAYCQIGAADAPLPDGQHRHPVEYTCPH